MRIVVVQERQGAAACRTLAVVKAIPPVRACVRDFIPLYAINHSVRGWCVCARRLGQIDRTRFLILRIYDIIRVSYYYICPRVSQIRSNSLIYSRGTGQQQCTEI